MRLESPQTDPASEYSSRIAIGDYIPYAYIENGRHVFDAQAKAGQPNLLIFLWVESDATARKALSVKCQYRTFVFTPTDLGIDSGRYFSDHQFCSLFHHELIPCSAYLVDNNLKVIDFVDAQGIDELEQEVSSITVPQKESPAPVLIINDAIDEVLAEDLIEYIDQHESAGSLVEKDFKRRLHIHPNKELERRLDDKLTKSVLPEIAKVFYSEITHRETYKICRYAGENSGKFGKHRDTIYPHLHRRYAMTLVLNDDYEGGGIAFPEYNTDVLNVPKYGAVIFPGSLFHQVNEIGSGNRYVIISFFFGEAEASVKQDSERYRFTVKRDVRGLKLNVLTPSS